MSVKTKVQLCVWMVGGLCVWMDVWKRRRNENVKLSDFVKKGPKCELKVSD